MLRFPAHYTHLNPLLRNRGSVKFVLNWKQPVIPFADKYSYYVVYVCTSLLVVDIFCANVYTQRSL